MMAEIRFDPWGLLVVGEEGDSLLDVALENNIPLQHACGGDAVCSTCAVRVIQGDAWLSTLEDLEEETLDKLLPERTLQTRLACQARLNTSSDSGRIIVASLEEERLPPA
jgi:2Fe-2S ferredoxin